MRSRGILVALALLVAGCVGTGQSANEDCPECGTTVAPEPVVSETTGALDGRVLDDEFNPIEDAQVGLEEQDLEAVTDAGGRFVFSNLVPGEHTLLAGALGYEAGAKTVQIEAGQTTEVHFVLPRLASAEPFPEVRTFQGLIECGFGTTALVGNCVPLQFLFQQLNFNPTNTRTVGLYEISDPTRVKGGVFEMIWKPSTGGSGQTLGLYVDLEGTGPTSGKNYAQKSGPSPVRIEVGEEPYKDLKPAENKKKVQTRTFLPATSPPSFVVDQRFTIYATACYNAPCDESYSAVADA